MASVKMLSHVINNIYFRVQQVYEGLKMGRYEEKHLKMCQ